MSVSYEDIQKQLRKNLKILLKRRPPSISSSDYDKLFDGVKNKDRKRLHFFTENRDLLEWKPNITVEDLRKLKTSNLDAILLAYRDSHNPKNRTAFPFLAPANKRRMLRDHTHPEGQCYGFDILIRKPTSSIEAAGERSLSIGDLSFALIIHMELSDDGTPILNPEYYIRAVWGESLRLCRLWENLRGPLDKIEPEVIDYLTNRDYFALTEAIVKVANRIAAVSFPL